MSNNNFYEFYENVDDYLNRCDISEENKPTVILGFLSGTAKKKVEERFGVNTIPDLDILKEFLQDKFGEPQLMITEIINSHAAIGQIPNEENYKGTTQQLSDIVQKHIDLIIKAKSVEKASPDSVYNSLSYFQALVKILPRHLSRKLLMETCSTNNRSKIRQAMREVENLKGYLENYIQHAVDHSGKHDGKHEGRQDKKHAEYHTRLTENNDSVRVDSEGKCGICQMMQRFGVKQNTNNLHKFSKNDYVELESCPYLRTQTTQHRASFTEMYEICRNCLKKPLSSHHQEKICKPLEILKHLKCGDDHCNKRAAVCFDHQSKNEKRLMEMKERYEKMGLEFKI